MVMDMDICSTAPTPFPFVFQLSVFVFDIGLNTALITVRPGFLCLDNSALITVALLQSYLCIIVHGTVAERMEVVHCTARLNHLYFCPWHALQLHHLLLIALLGCFCFSFCAIQDGFG